MSSSSVEHDRTPPRPGLAGAAAYLLMNLPLGIISFVTLVTLICVGVPTTIIWVGVPIAALAVLLARGSARLERARVYALLDTPIALPYRRLPEDGQKQRWKARLRDPATWRDLTYFLLLLPVGIVEFVLMVTFWALSLGLAALPVYFRYLPEGAYFFPAYDLRWITIDTTLSALPFAALGVLLLAVTVALTRKLGALHARFARGLLTPTVGTLRSGDAVTFDAGFSGAVAGW